MSEAIEGLEFTPPPAKIRDAAAVILVRRQEGPDREVFWVRRGEKLTFSGGFYAFPGGKVDKGDAAVPIENCPADEVALQVCALRETFEETGVLLARGAERLGAGRLDELRRELLGGASFAALLASEGLVLDGRALFPAGRWLTPPFSPVRFDARFYLAYVPAGQTAEVIPGELSDGGWIRPHEALARWEAGTALLHPPNHHALATLAGFAPEAALPRLRTPPFCGADHVVERIEFQRGILLLPLRTPTLPPAQHTNCWVAGTGELALIDPGSPWAEEQALLERHLRELIAEGRKPKYVLVTHHHGDHVGAAVEIGRRLGIPVWGSAETAARVPGVEGRLADGDVIELCGPLSMRLRAILTEGHADGHLCFLEERTGALFAGDMVAGGSTIVIDPPEGDMGRYLASLRRLLELQAGVLYPAHGFPIPDGPAKLAAYLGHRESRMEQIRGAVAQGASALADIVERVYSDTPAFLHPVAERSALASLIELEKRGQARRTDRGWTAL
ncbi:MBL fold metallo-hydrolase [Vulgatibacter sp.]|uniref:MBL fold metallo-hydrolase n=1 Tax=Vulgatibacter sp. TaxID=1971226 RepID=UPI00356AADB5